VGLTSQKWANLIDQNITRTVIVTNEPMLEKVAKRRARASTAGRTKASLHPSDKIDLERAARFEKDVAGDLGQGGKLRAIFDVWGPTPEDVLWSVSQLEGAAINSGIILERLSNRQDKTVNAAMPTTRDLRKPDIPLGLQLLGSK
jgi:hypothetical protein